MRDGNIIKRNLNIRSIALILFFLTFAIRFIYILETRDHILYKDISTTIDSAWYNELSQEFQEGNFTRFGSYFSPLYPLFLSMFYKVFGQDLFLVRIFQAFLDSVTVILIFLICAKIFSKTCALISALIYTFYSMSIFYTGLIIQTCLVTFFLVASVYLLVKFFLDKRYKKLKLLLSAVCLGLASLGRPNLFILAPVYLIWIILKRELHIKKKVVNAAVFITGMAIMILPFTLRNILIEKDFIILTSHGGINFYIGNNEQAQGIYNVPFSHQELNLESTNKELAKNESERRSGKQMKMSEVSRFWYGQGLRFLVNIRKSVLLYLTKVTLFSNSFEIPLEYSFYFYRNFSGILKLPLVNFRILFPLSLLGFFFTVPVKLKNNLLIFLKILTIVYIAGIILFFVCARYRLIIIPFLSIFASIGIINLFSFVKRRRFIFFISSILFLSVAILISNVRIEPFNRSWHLNKYLSRLGRTYMLSGNYMSAKKYLNQAIEISDDDVPVTTFMDLAKIYRDEGDLELAKSYLIMALKKDPDNLVIYVNLSYILIENREFDKAKGTIQDALERFNKQDLGKSELAKLHNNLGIVFVNEREFEKAEKEFLLCETIIPEFSWNLTDLAVLYIITGRLEKAEEKLHRAIEIDHKSKEAFYNLAYIEFANGKNDKALHYLKRTLEIDKDFKPALELMKKLK